VTYEEHMEKYIDTIPPDADDNVMMAMVVIESRKYVKKLQEENTNWQDSANRMAESMDKLESENKVLKEALTYIATRNNINRFSLQKKAKETLSKLKEK